MFFTIPATYDIITNTPIDIKAITHVFFENKNSGIYKNNNGLETISITIDGKQICRDVPILPFCTNGNSGAKYRWQDVALEVNLNVKNSEIVIDSNSKNDYNIVFVCTDYSIDESRGFDFIETKKFCLKNGNKFVTFDSLMLSVANLFKNWNGKTDFFSNLQMNGGYELLKQQYNQNNVTIPLSEQNTIKNKLKNFVVGSYINYSEDSKDYKKTDIVKSLIPEEQEADFDAESFAEFMNLYIGNQTNQQFLFNIIEDANTVISTHLTEQGVLGVEHTFVLDKAPKQILAYSYYTPQLKEIEETNYANYNVFKELNNVEINDAKMNITLSVSDGVELPNNTDIDIFRITRRLGANKAKYAFVNPANRNIQLELTTNGNITITPKLNNGKSMFNWYLYLMFIYKKIA